MDTGFKIDFFEEIDSTNEEVKRSLRNGTAVNRWVVRAGVQRSGRGQFGTLWESEADKNLLFSLLIAEDDLPADRPFQLNMTICRVLADKLKSRIPELKIKWPNDLYVGNRKLGGVLIENQWSAGRWQSAVVGVGINCLQRSFLSAEAVSLIQLGLDVPPGTLLSDILHGFSQRWGEWSKLDWEESKKAYTQELLGFRSAERYRFLNRPETEVFEASIEEVFEDGSLMLRGADNRPIRASFKEIARLPKPTVPSS